MSKFDPENDLFGMFEGQFLQNQAVEAKNVPTHPQGARIFDLTVTSIDVIGPQQLATEELAIHYVQHF